MWSWSEKQTVGSRFSSHTAGHRTVPLFTEEESEAWVGKDMLLEPQVLSLL